MQDCSSGKIINSLFFLLRIYGFRFLVTSSRCQAKSKFLLILLSSNKMKEDVFLPTTLPTSIKFPLILLKAFAKISFRLVGDQDPEDIRLNFRKKLRNEIPDDFEIKFSNHKGSKATQFPLNDQVINKAKKALSDEWNSNTVFEGGGGSIPIVQHFKNILEMDTLLVGFAQDDDNIHSPNEKYNLNSFYKGARSWVRIIYEISK